MPSPESGLRMLPDHARPQLPADAHGNGHDTRQQEHDETGKQQIEPVLAEFGRAFGAQLEVAQKPSPCMARAGGRDAEHHFYTRLVNDLAIYGLALARRERTLQRLERLLADYRAQPATFACTLVPRQGPDALRAGCR